MTWLAASLWDVAGIVAGVVLALTGAALAILGAMTAAEGYARRGLVTLTVGVGVAAAGLWWIGVL